MAGEFILTGKVMQLVADGEDVNNEQDLAALKGLAISFVCNIPEGMAVPWGSDISYIFRRTATLLADGSISEDGVNPGITLLANDPSLGINGNIQWKVMPRGVSIGGRSIRLRSWVFDAPAPGVNRPIGMLTPVPNVVLHAGGPRGEQGVVTEDDVEEAVSDYLATHPLTVDWSQVNAKPATFPPSAHAHDWTTGVTGKPATYPPVIGPGAAQAVAGNDSRLTDARTPTAHSHGVVDLTASGTKDSTTVLFGDNTWKTVPSGRATLYHDFTNKANGAPAAASDSGHTWTKIFSPRAASQGTILNGGFVCPDTTDGNTSAAYLTTNLGSSVTYMKMYFDWAASPGTTDTSSVCMAASTVVLPNSAGLLQPLTGVELPIHVVSTKNYLEYLVYTGGAFVSLGSVNYPTALVDGQDYAIEVVVDRPNATAYVRGPDGRLSKFTHAVLGTATAPWPYFEPFNINSSTNKRSRIRIAQADEKSLTNVGGHAAALRLLSDGQDAALSLKTLTNPIINGAIYDVGQSPFLSLLRTPNAVNYVGLYNNASGGGPVIAAMGTDPSVDLNLASKGTGKVKMNGVNIAREPTGATDGTKFFRDDFTWAVPAGGGGPAYTPDSHVSVKSYGAAGDGTTDDTTAFANAYADANSSGKALAVPPGVYLVTALPDFADRTRITGAGGGKSMIRYNGTGTLRTLTNKYGIQFSDVGFVAYGAGATLLTLSNSFRTSFTRCIFRGQHTSTAATYRGQNGLNLINNSGATNLIDCDFENFGIGLRTTAIQNEMTGGKFTSCYTSVYGVGGTASAGMYFVNTEFIGSATNGVTNNHVLIDGTADSWSFVNCWMEKVQTALNVGVAGTGGPSQFSFIGGKIAGSVVGLQLNHCRQAFLAATKFDVDDFGTGTDVSINATNCPEGTALNLISITRADFQDSDFPQYWTISRKGSFRAGNITASNATINGTLTLNNALTARINPRVLPLVNATTVDVNSDNYDGVENTGITGNVTINAPSGTPVAGQRLRYAFTGTAARTLTWNAIFEANGSNPLPTTTLGTTRIDVDFIWNPVTSKFRMQDEIPASVYKSGGTDVNVADGGTGRSLHTAYAPLVGGTTTTSAQQSMASAGTFGQVVFSGGASGIPTWANMLNVTTLNTTGALTASAGLAYLYRLLSGAVPTMPTAVGNTSFYWIKNETTGSIVLSTTSSQTIEGATTYTLVAGESITIYSDNANWRII